MSTRKKRPGGNPARGRKAGQVGLSVRKADSLAAERILLESQSATEIDLSSMFLDYIPARANRLGEFFSVVDGQRILYGVLEAFITAPNASSELLIALERMVLEQKGNLANEVLKLIDVRWGVAPGPGPATDTRFTKLGGLEEVAWLESMITNSVHPEKIRALTLVARSIQRHSPQVDLHEVWRAVERNELTPDDVLAQALIDASDL